MTVIDSTFDGNSAACRSGGTGGSIGQAGGNLVMRGAQIQNSSAGFGGALWYGPVFAAEGSIENSVFVGNYTFVFPGEPVMNTPGGAVLLRKSLGGLTMSARNNTFALNRTKIGPGAHLTHGGIVWRAFHSNIFGETGLKGNGLPSEGCDLDAAATYPTTPSFSVAADETCGAFANMHVVAPAGIGVEVIEDPDMSWRRVRLKPTSVAVDAGSPLTPSPTDPLACVTLDVDGVTRPQDGDNDGVARCDIGAMELGSNHLFADGFEG